MFDSNNKLYKYLNIYFVTRSKTTIKVSLSLLSIPKKHFSNTNIALKKKGVDNTTTITIVIAEISLLAS